MVEENTTAVEWYKKNCERVLDNKNHYTNFKISSEYQDCSTCFSLDMYSLCMYSCTYCLHGDTEVVMFMRSPKRKKIKDICVGDRLKTFNLITKKIEKKYVTNVMKRMADSYLIITVGNKELKVTKEHPIYTKDGWKPAGELKENDEILWLYDKLPQISERMRNNNPMKNKEVSKKMEETIHRQNEENKLNGIVQ